MSYEEEVKNCKFLLEPQKKKLLELEHDSYGEGYAESLIDFVFQKVMGFGVDDLSTMEQVDLRNAIKDYLK